MSLLGRIKARFQAKKDIDRYDQIAKSYNEMRAQQFNFPLEPSIIEYPQNGAQLHSLVNRVPVIRTCIDNLMMQHYRNLPMLKPKFLSKCPLCGVEYQESKDFCDNPVCSVQAVKCVPPDTAQKEIFMKWKDRVNRNNDSYWDVCKRFTYDVHVSDNPWRIYTFDYMHEPISNSITKKLLEVTVPRPDSMRLVMDQYGIPGGLFWTCIVHRNVLQSVQEDKVCPECGMPLYNVTAVSVKRASQGNVLNTEDIDKPFIDGEWYHKPYYTPTNMYGVSEVYSVWTLGTALYYMDNLELNTFKMGRPPKTLLLFNHHNYESLKNMLKSEFTAAKENRNYIPTLCFPFEGKTPAQTMNLMPTDAEIQNLEHRKDIRDRIGATFGVQPIFQADSSTGGGLNNEGQQLTVTLIRMETLHRWEEEGAFRADFQALGITDWMLEYPPLKEEDRMAVQMRRKENLQMIGQVLDRGADYIVVDPNDWEFKVVGKMKAFPKNDGGMPGGGFKEMGGGLQGWNMRDWMQQDSTFAFSLKKNDMIREYVAELLDNLRLASAFPPEVRTGAVHRLVSEFLDKFTGYLREHLSRFVRIGLDMVEHDYATAEIDPDKIRELMESYFVDYDSDFFDQSWKLVEDYFSTRAEDALQAYGEFMTAKLENILDTESSAFVNYGMAEGYRLRDPTDARFDYHWSGPDYSPGRSTLVCQAIKDRFERVRSEKGRVSLADAETVIREEGDRPHGKEKAFRLGRAYLPHYRCRHRLVATPVLSKSIIYIHDRSEAPAGVNVLEGPHGGLYYETNVRDNAGEGAVDGRNGDAADGGDGEGGVTDGAGAGPGGAEYFAVGLRGPDGKWETKFYKPEDRDRIEQLLQQQGFTLGEDYTVSIAEAVKEEVAP